MIDLISIEQNVNRKFKGHPRKTVNKALYAELIRLFPECQDLYQSVAYKTIQINKQLGFEPVPKQHAAFTAYTKNYEREIVICITTPITTEDGSSIFTHELGEADYIASQLPYLWDPEDGNMYRIVEIFSHPHIRQLAAQYNLEYTEGLFRNNLTEYFLNEDYEKHIKEWKIVMMISWAILTFPEIVEKKETIRGYIERKDSIEKLLLIRNSVNTFTSSNEEIRKAFDNIIEELITLGMPSPGKIV